MSLSTTLGTIFVQKRRDSLTISLTTCPVVASHCILHSLLLFSEHNVLVFDLHGPLTNHGLIFSQNLLLVDVVSAGLGLRNGVDSASEVDFSPWIIVVGKLTVFIDVN